MEKRGQIRIKKVIQVFGKAATEEDVKYVKKKNKKIFKGDKIIRLKVPRCSSHRRKLLSTSHKGPI